MKNARHGFELYERKKANKMRNQTNLHLFMKIVWSKVSNSRPSLNNRHLLPFGVKRM